jgi:hypothetical protein
MATALKTWAKVRAPVLCIRGTGSGVGIPLARGGKISTPGVPPAPPIVADTYNIVYEGPIFLGDQQTMMRTDFNPSTITGSVSAPAAVRTPYFTADSPFFPDTGEFTEWTAATLGNDAGQTLTNDQKNQLIGQEVTTTTTFFVMTADAFGGFGQSYTPGSEYIVGIGNLTEV